MSPLSTVVRTDFAAAIQQIANERKISADSIYQAIKQALISAYRKEFNDQVSHYLEVELDQETGQAKILAAPVLATDPETGEIIKWDAEKLTDVTPAGFGRIAAQTAKQVILQKIRQSEKDQLLAEFQDRLGELITSQVLRMSGRTVVMDLDRSFAWMPPEEQMRGEFYRINQRLPVIIKEIRSTSKGEVVIVSRADARLVSKLFEREVPEVAGGSVEIVRIAREAGVRTKLTVRATQEGVDPIGSCVGQRGSRVQKVIEGVNNEKIDIIPHSDDLKTLLAGALAPAENLKIELDPNHTLATVIAPDDQLSLVIGRGGQNARLAAKLCKIRITIKSSSGQVASSSTGEEEFEIDTINGLDVATRKCLVEFKLTTFSDLEYFADKWQSMDSITAEQKQLLKQAVKNYKEQQASLNIVDDSDRNLMISVKKKVKHS